MMNRYVILLLILISSWETQAQEDLSLSDAIQLGLENNFNIKISELTVASAEANNNWTQAGKGPTVTLLMRQNQVYGITDNPTSFVNGQLLSISSTPIVNANWVLFGGYAVRIAKGQLGLLEQQSKQNASIIVENVTQATVLAYYKCVLEKKKMLVMEKVMTTSSEQKRLAEEKKQLGVLSTFDYLQHENTFLTDSINYLLTKMNYSNSVRNLNLIMSAPVESQYVFTDSLKPAPDVLPVETIEETMFTDNHNLQKEFLNSELIKKEASLKKSALYPIVTMDVGMGGNATLLMPFGSLLTTIQDDLNTTARVGFGSGYQAYLNFTLAWTLYDGKKRRADIQNSITRLEAADYSIAEMKQTMSSDMRKTHSLYVAQLELNRVNKKKKETSALSNQLGFERWKMGLLNSFDYRTIQLDYLSSEISLEESYYNQWASYLEISRMSGGILKDLGVE